MKKMKFVSLIGVCLMMSGCALFKTDKEPPVCLTKVDISLDSDANQDSALAVDLLMIYKKDLLDTVMKMSARDYFLSANQIKRDYPEMVDIWHWELTPSQVVTNYPITQRDDPPVGAVFFADYLSPGDHRVRFGAGNHGHIRAKRYDFCILEQGCSSDISHQSITTHGMPTSPKTQAIAGTMQKSGGGGSENPLADMKKAEKSAQSEIKELKKDIEGFKKLF